MKSLSLSALLSLALAIAALPVTAQEPSPAQTEPANPSDPVIITPDTRAYRYQCSGGQTFDVEFSLELATLALESETLRLAQILAASGARYSDGTITLYTKGEEAFITMGDQIIYADCVGESIAVSQIHRAEREAGVTEEPVTQPITFVCDHDLTFQVAFTPEQATLMLENETLVLSQIPAASGAQYSDGQTLLATRGDAAFVEVEGTMVYENCLAQAETAGGVGASVEQTETETQSQLQPQPTTVEPAPAPALSSPPSRTEPSSIPVRALW